MYRPGPDEMFDQASGLRRMLGQAPARVLTVVGDENVRDRAVIGIAQALDSDGDRVAVVDENNSLAMKLGLPARHELADSLSGDVDLGQVFLRVSEHLAVLPAARGLRQLRSKTNRPAESIAKLCEGVAPKPNFILCATALIGQKRGRIGLIGEGEVLLVVTANAEGVTAAYASLKALTASFSLAECSFLVTSSKSEAGARAVSENLVQASQRFLGVRLNYCGFMPPEPTWGGTSTRGLFRRIIERTAERRFTTYGREQGFDMRAGSVQ